MVAEGVSVFFRNAVTSRLLMHLWAALIGQDTMKLSGGDIAGWFWEG